MDTVGAVAFSAAGLAFLFSQRASYGWEGSDQTKTYVLIGGLEVMAALFAVSGVYGFLTVSECVSRPADPTTVLSNSEAQGPCVTRCASQKVVCDKDWNALLAACIRRAGRTRAACAAKFGPYVCDEYYGQCVDGC